MKTLEEPPPQSVLILISTSPAKQLPTIRSRCQLVRFRPLAADIVAKLLVEKGLVADTIEARRLAEHSEGSVQRAMDLSDPELWAFRGKLLEALAAATLPSVQLAATVSAFVDEAGKEASARRGRLRLVVGFAAEYFEQLMKSRSGARRPTTRSCGDSSPKRPQALRPMASRSPPHAWIDVWRPSTRSTATRIRRH